MPAPSAAPKIAVIHYSWTGTVHELAKYVAEGAQRAGAEVRLLKVRELASAGPAAPARHRMCPKRPGKT